METIQVVLDKKILRATDPARRGTKQNRPALVREALRKDLRLLERRVLEDRDREGYSRQPQQHDKSPKWEAEAAWPQE
jgi:hypothetical protein